MASKLPLASAVSVVPFCSVRVALCSRSSAMGAGGNCGHAARRGDWTLSAGWSTRLRHCGEACPVLASIAFVPRGLVRVWMVRNEMRASMRVMCATPKVYRAL